jgi:hypothetical protein
MRTAVEKIKNVTVDTPASSFSVYRRSCCHGRCCIWREKRKALFRREERRGVFRPCCSFKIPVNTNAVFLIFDTNNPKISKRILADKTD